MYTASGTKDKSSLLQTHSSLVKKIAGILKSRLPASVEIDDLIQAGMIGLWESINNFDATQNVLFETYASQRIRGAMLDELRSGDWAPRKIRKQMRDVEAAIAQLKQQLGRPPKESDVANYLGMSLDEYQSVLSDNAGHQLVYIEDLSGDEDNAGFLDRFSSDSESDPLRMLLHSAFRQDLIDAIEDLPEREKIMMGLYYEQELNLKEIGAVLGVTEARTCQIHAQAIARLRSSLKERLWTGVA
jgi:RNA polymerase sigma factor for flagellar operon FliA